ncbi:hypothetical protein AAFF_G00048410 [Aldrovandia affinis]|uniref:A-kinase anchor protein 6 n=1 Tax=Aldrovandia affinis TaxID=143900 RepID=A0AAD7WEW6_9TELE|nr:hypothetical protein AAFF_G00048410 [Aldrovandia affinis]
MYPEESRDDDAAAAAPADLSRSTPSLLDPPDRSKFWLELTSVYPSGGGGVSQSYDSLPAARVRIGPAGGDPAPLKRCSSETGQASDPEDRPAPLQRPGVDPNDRRGGRAGGRGESPAALADTQNPPGSAPPLPGDPTNPEPPPPAPAPLPKPRRARPTPRRRRRRRGSRLSPSGSSRMSWKEDRWFGSDEYLALPAQLRKTEMLALKLETLAKALPPPPTGDGPLQDVDDWELSEAPCDEWDASPPFARPRPYHRPFFPAALGGGRLSPSSSSDVAPSLDDSIESGPLSDLLLSEDEAYCDYAEGGGSSGLHKPLVQQLLEDIRDQENDQDVWGKIEGFVGKLDEFIRWLRESLESTENWTPPRAETDSLRLYLETHLSFKLSVDSHCSLKDSVLDEGRLLLELIISHKSGLRDMLQMISLQWQELQKQVRRQHRWILRALDALKAQVLSRDGPTGPHCDAAGPKGEVQRCHSEAESDALDQMALRLQSQQHYSSSKRRDEFAQMSKVNSIGSNSLLDFEAEFQELWDWLTDMESIVMDSHELMMSEEQQQHLYKGNSVEMAMWLPRKAQLLDRAQDLHCSGADLPSGFHERISALTRKWDLLQRILGEHADAPGPGSPTHDPRALLSPETNGLLEQLQGRVRELKAWLRDTELLIFNACLRQERELQDPHASKQLQYFRSLCSEVRGRRRGVASVLRLCQSLLEQQESFEPEAERQALQLLSVNLERRWEAIVMQAVQWQTRLQRALGSEQVLGTVIEPSYMDLHTPAEDSWEWDETDISSDLISVESRNLGEKQSRAGGKSARGGSPGSWRDAPRSLQNRGPPPPLSPPSRPRTYQVYSVREVALYDRPQFPPPAAARAPGPKQPLMKSLSKDSSFCSAESLPDLLLLLGRDGRGRNSGDSGARRSESESGIVSEGDTETAESCAALRQAGDGSAGSVPSTPPSSSSSRIGSCTASTAGPKGGGPGRKRRDESTEERKRRHNRRDAVEIVLADGRFSLAAAESEGEELDPGAFRAGGREALACASQGSSLDSLFAAADLFGGKDTLHRSTSLESWLAPCRSAGGAGSQHSLGEPELELPGENTGELSRRTLELLRRLEDIQSPFAGKMTRSISDITLQSGSLRPPLSLGAAGGPGGPLLLRTGWSRPTPTPPSADAAGAPAEAATTTRLPPPPSSSSSPLLLQGQQQQQQQDEADASVSMVVNVSCTSAGTDDEDDSDLLSSSTLTLTEEELGVKEEEGGGGGGGGGGGDGDSSLASDNDEDDDQEGHEYLAGGFALGLEYMKKELQNWIRPRPAARDKGEPDLGDELQCGTASRESAMTSSCPSAVPTTTTAAATSEKRFLSRAALKLLEANANSGKSGQRREEEEEEEEGRREEEAIRRRRNSMSRFVDDLENGNVESPPVKGADEDAELLREEGSLFTKSGLLSLKQPLNEGPLEGQLSGEIPCHSSRRPPAPGPAPAPPRPRPRPRPDPQPRPARLLPQRRPGGGARPAPALLLRRRPPPPPPPPEDEEDKEQEESQEDVHNFVMEIIDMASVALRYQGARSDRRDPPGSAAVTQIRDKVLEHSHRPIHLRKGDFYAYLSLSSHDSDCGEVSTCAEDKGGTPLPDDIIDDAPDVRDDEEPLFQPCTEEVYLGPPLCYSMCMSKRTGLKPGAGPPPQTTRDGAPPPPPACAEYQKAPGVSSPGSAAGSQLEGSDREERGPASQRVKQKNVRKGCSSLQEAKSTHKQSPGRERGLARDGPGPIAASPASCASLSRYATARESGATRPLAKRVSGSPNAPPSSKPRP